MAGELRAVRTILVGTDLGEESRGAALMAGALAKRLGAALHLAHAVEPLSAMHERAIPGFAAKREAQARTNVAAYARTHGLDGATVHTLQGAADTGLLKLADQVGADLIVVGRYGRGGPKQGHLGSVAARLVRRSPVDVLVVQPDQGGEIRRIGVASDLEESPEIELGRGLQLAGRLGLSEIVLLHAYEVPAGHHLIESWEEAVGHLGDVARKEAEAIAGRVASPGGPAVRVRVEEGPAAATIARMVTEEQLDLLVISTHRRTNAAELLLTQTSERIVNRTPCSVWAEKDSRLFQDLRRAVTEWLD